MPVKMSPPTNQHTMFLQAGCPSCRPTNSVEALKGNIHAYIQLNLHSLSTKQTFEVKAAGTLHAVGATERDETRRSDVDWFTQQLSMSLTAVVQRLFPQQARDVVHPVTADRRRLTAQCVRRTRQPLAEPQLKRVVGVTHSLRQTNIGSLHQNIDIYISVVGWLVFNDNLPT